MDKQDILKSNKITRWTNSVGKNSRIRYEYFAKEYFTFINQNPDTYIVDDYEFLELTTKAKIAAKYKKDLQDFKNKLMNQPNKRGTDNKSTSIRTALSSIKSLFVFSQIDFPTAFWKSLINFDNERKSVTETPSSEQLRKILDHTDIQGKCIFLIMATSGSRIDSVLQLRRKDIDMQHEHPRVTFSYKHAKSWRTKIKRISQECKHHLESYLSSNSFSPESRLFRMTRQNADYKWKCALKKAGLYKLDENTKRCTMTTHSLKRYFKTNFSKANFGNNEQWADYFCEHQSDLDRRYKDYDEKFIDEQYSKGVQYLLVYEKSYDTDSRVQQLQKAYDEVKGKNKFLTDRLSIIEGSVDNYEKRFNEIEQNLNISLNPDTPTTKEFLDSIYESLKLSAGKEIAEQFKLQAIEVLIKAGKMDKKTLLEICKIQDLNEITKEIKSH